MRSPASPIIFGLVIVAMSVSAQPRTSPSGSKPPASKPPPDLSACNIQCQDLEKRTALVLEYDLCEIGDRVKNARKEKRVFKRSPDDQLSEGGRCLAEHVKGTPAQKWGDAIVVPKGSERLASGNQAFSGDLSMVRACLGPIGFGRSVPPAHRDLTRDALKNTPGFKYGNDTSEKLVELASEEPDTFEWLSPPSHAQTPDGVLPTNANPVRDFEQHVTSVSNKIRAACCSKRPSEVAYQLGYLFHAIQDLSTHAGMSNSHHAYLLPRGNPDMHEPYLKRALKWTKEALKAYSQSSFGTCLKEASGVPAARVDWAALALSGGYGVKDSSANELRKFASGALRLDAPPDRRWFDQDHPTAPQTWFEAHVLRIVKASVSSACE